MTEKPLNPQWAWSTFQPSQDQPWDHAAAAHLFRRAGFGATKHQIDEAVSRQSTDVVDELVSAKEDDAFRQQMDALVRATLATANTQQLAAQWVYRMLATPAPLLEKMTLFWHGHFATSAAKVMDAQLMQQQNELFRQFALGDFAELTLHVARDPAMLLYLDSATNRKSHPNENFARELMELFCLGEGNYREEDIRELARCFTGWEVKRRAFRVNRYQHDDGVKSVLGVTGRFDGTDGVAVVIQHPAAPRFIASKLVRYFVMDEPAVAPDLIEPLAVELRENGMRVAPTVRRILSSNLFFSSFARGRKIRSPIDFAIGFLRALEGSTDAHRLVESIGELGQALYYPPSVKGWDGGRAWINSSTLLGRANLIQAFLSDGKTRFGRQKVTDYFHSLGVDDPKQLVDLIQTLLFAVAIPRSARERVVELAGGSASQRRGFGGVSDPTWLPEAIHLLCTLPEFQLA